MELKLERRCRLVLKLLYLNPNADSKAPWKEVEIIKGTAKSGGNRQQKVCGC